MKNKTTHTYLANSLGMNVGYLNMILRGRKPVSLKLAYDWSQAFPEKSIEWFKTVKPEYLEAFFIQKFNHKKDS